MTAWRDKSATVTARQLEPGEDESEDDFLDRCADEDIDDDACQLIWDNAKSVQDGIIHKTHAAPVEEMEFVLSDESTDRMGDIIMSDGWSLTSSQEPDRTATQTFRSALNPRRDKSGKRAGSQPPRRARRRHRRDTKLSTKILQV
jgi:hypothetical protein